MLALRILQFLGERKQDWITSSEIATAVGWNGHISTVSGKLLQLSHRRLVDRSFNPKGVVRDSRTSVSMSLYYQITERGEEVLSKVDVSRIPVEPIIKERNVVSLLVITEEVMKDVLEALASTRQPASVRELKPWLNMREEDIHRTLEAARIYRLAASLNNRWMLSPEGMTYVEEE